MQYYTFVVAGSSPATDYACAELEAAGHRVSAAPLPCATHLLLPIPSFEANGQIRGGGDLKNILSLLPENITVIGGNLSHPDLNGYPCIDLLQDEEYLLPNAHITAHCALKIALNQAAFILAQQPVLVIGWGRIGKKLAQLLESIGADVTVAARKEADRIEAQRAGCHGIPISHIIPENYKVIFNTAPALILPHCPDRCLAIDLASCAGLGGNRVISARGLPGKLAPISAGQLIAERIFVHLQQSEVTP